MRFLIVGDLLIDRYWRGNISRLNPEKHSVPLLRCRRDVVDRPGGAANVAANITAMGAEAVLVSQRFGTVIKNRLLDEHDGVIARFDEEDECLPIAPDTVALAADDCCAVIVADYGKGAIDQYVIDQVRALDLPTFVDAKVNPHRWVEWCEAMFPNEREFHLHKDDYHRSKLVIVKCGANGVRLPFYGLKPLISSKATRVKNVAGAGDTVIAAYTVLYMALDSSDLATSERILLSLSTAMDFAGAAVADPLTAAPTFTDVYGSNVPEPYCRIMEELKR